MPPVLNIPRFAHLRKLSLQSRDLAVFLQQPAFLAHLESLDVSMALIHLLECDVLDALSPIHQHPNISISIHLHRFNILAPASVFNTMERCIDFALAMGTRWDGVFGRVRNLTLGDAGCNNLSASREFSRWLGLFPAAETVSWDDYSTVAGPSLRTRQIAQKVDRHVLNGAVSAVLVAPTSASGTASNFLSLPDDIILAFFEYLSDELFDLSLVSRRLNFLALPVCLSREDIVDRLTGQYTVLIGPYPRARDALAALNVALFLPSVKSLHCHISRALHIYPLLNHLRRLISFMERLPSVGEVSLQFGTTDSTPPLTHYDPLQYQWCALFEQLLNIIVAKSCVSLSVNGSPYLFPSHMTWKARILDEHKKKVILTPPNGTSLRVFAFEPSSLLSPIFMPWTTATIRHSAQLSRVDILINSDLDQFYLDALVGLISRLRELKITISRSFRVRDHLVLGFIHQLTALEHLHIHGSSTSPVRRQDPLSTPGSSPRLLHLESLHAPGAHVNALLSVMNNPLPALEALEIDVLLASQQTLGTFELPSIFAHLARRGSPLPAVTLSVKFLPSTPDGEWPLRAFDEMLGAEAEWVTWCPRITALKVTATWPINAAASTGSYQQIFRERLGRFTELMDVAFIYYSMVEDYSDEDEAEKVKLTVQAIKAGLPQIQSIRINGKQCR